MRFHLDHSPKKFGFQIDHTQQSFLIGSCFSTNIADILNDHKYKVYNNPDGILFNPISIGESLEKIVSQTKTNNNHLLQRDGSYYSFLHHSSINAASEKELIQKIDLETDRSHAFLKTADYLIITFGTAYYYHHTELSTAVANCHKQPGNLFEKKLLAVNDVVNRFKTLLQHIQNLNPQLKVIFTVSPVKYLKDGLVENSISKSTLILAVHELISLNTNCYYFPAYELVSDDLRDYRFYKEDMAHPNQQAIDYVWQKFGECFFNRETQILNDKLHKLNQALKHRKMHENSVESLKLDEFITKQQKEIKKLNPKIEF